MEVNKDGDRKNGVYTCKSNVSQRCIDSILEIAEIWENAPNASTCKDEDPNYKLVQQLAKQCDTIFNKQ